MDDDTLPLPSHVTRGNGIYHYVRRVPLDLRDACSPARIQLSLKTRSPAEAFASALRIDTEIDSQFAQLRRELCLVREPV